MTLVKYISKGGKGQKELTQYIKDDRIIDILLKNNVNSLRPIQIQAIEKGLFFQKNFLICTPSGSGKTLIGELAIVSNVLSNLGKGIYLVPYKALAAEKYSYFTKNYKRLGITTALSIGDFESDEVKLKNADIIITTFEKLDSLMRNRNNGDSWINEISTVVVDEIHIMGDSHRGFKLESLIIRLMASLYDLQMICLSATISNPENLCSWLTKLSKELSLNSFFLIKSDIRPVDLKYQIQIAGNKDSHIRKKIKECLAKKGQVLVFVSTRRSSRKCADEFKNTTKSFLDEISIKKLKTAADNLKKVQGTSPELRTLIKHGIAYHNAGLISQERHAIERLFNNRHIKVICCTTTLAAGVNTPARIVILRDFKRRNLWSKIVEEDMKKGTISEEYFESPGTDSGYFIPFSNNQTFQLLGRAGRPGLDLMGEGIIIVKNRAEFEWVEDHYFYIDEKNKKYLPKYNPIGSSFNKIGALREQILLLSHQESGITLNELITFFRRTYFSFNFGEEIKLENYLLIKDLDTASVLHLHADGKNTSELCKNVIKIEINKKNTNLIDINIQTNRLYGIKFDINSGIFCSCGFKSNPEELKDKHNIRNNYNFCDHIISFLAYIIQNNNSEIIKYLDDIIPGALKSERIIDFLIREGFLVKKINKFYPTALGSLTINLYIKPIDMIYLRGIILGDRIYNQEDLLKSVCKFLRIQGKFRDESFVICSLMWIEEREVDDIVEFSEKITAGDFFSLKDELVRVLVYFNAVAGFYGKSNISDMAETLSMRVDHGIKEQLLDLVVRISGVGRKRGRRLYDTGFHAVLDVCKSNPADIHSKTKIPGNICKKIHKNALKIKKKI